MTGILKRAREFGFTEAEALYADGKSTELQVLNHRVSQYESSNCQGLSFRGVYDGQMGYAYTEVFDDDSMNFLLEQAKENALSLESNERETVYAGDPFYRDVKSYEEDLDSLTYKDLEEMTLSLERKLLDLDPRIDAVDHCICSYDRSSEHIRNTLGMKLFQKSNLFFLYADVRCSADDQVKTASGFWFGRDIKKLDVDVLAKKIGVRALSKLGASTVDSIKCKVLLDGEAASDLLDAYSGIFSAEAIQKGFSLLGDRIGHTIASSLVTLRDDALAEGSITATAFDSEGVATQNRALIEKGVLTGILHNRKTAEKDGVPSTGNGFRGYKGSLSIGSKNLYFLPGQTTRDELLQTMNNGIYITEISGLHAGTNTVSGDFSLLCEGFSVENGKIARAVEQITVADNFFALLEKIVGIGNTIHFNPPSGAGSTGSPDLLISEISISGN